MVLLIKPKTIICVVLVVYICDDKNLLPFVVLVVGGAVLILLL